MRRILGSRLGMVTISLCIGLLIAELGARLAYAHRDDILTSWLIPADLSNQLHLDAYEMAVPEHGLHWVLRPGFEVTADKAVALKQRTKKFLSADQALSGDAVLRVNQDGYRGSEIRHPPGQPRILMLGDSVTFGMIDASYPIAVESFLRAKGFDSEVINGGVEGYAIRNHLIELDRYLKLKPDYVTILIGWNDIYSRRPVLNKLEDHMRLVWLARRGARAASAMFMDQGRRAQEFFSKPKVADLDSEELVQLEGYSPDFLGPLKELVQRFQKNGSEVILMTLPGLVTEAEISNAEAMAIAHMPEFTDNPYVLVHLTNIYNESIRALGVETLSKVIDLAEWSEESFIPRHEFFIDSVHANSDGLRKIAMYIASSIAEFENEKTASRFGASLAQ